MSSQPFFNSSINSLGPKPIPSILELPFPNSITYLFQRPRNDNLLLLNLNTEPNSSRSSSEIGSPQSPCASSTQSSLDKPEVAFDRTKGLWSSQEDNALRDAISKVQGNISWEDISKSVPGRNPKQCRERWLYRLCPGVNKTPFQKWEDELIVLERQKIGNHWTAIAAKLPGRTSYAVKNRWYTVLRNRISNSDQKSIMPSQKYIPAQPMAQPTQIYFNQIQSNVETPYFYSQPKTFLMGYV